jgi:uncharacterized membrane protein
VGLLIVNRFTLGHRAGVFRRLPYVVSMSNEDRRAARRAVGLATLLGTAGTLHFVRPTFFDPIVPPWMPGRARTTTYVSGVAELASAVLVAFPRTRRLGGWAAAATFLSVFPANIDVAMRGGMSWVDPPFDSAAAAWLRLPVQIPLIVWGRRVALDATD